MKTFHLGKFNMNFRIADSHVHLEDVKIGEFDKPLGLLNTLAKKNVTDVSLLAYMPFSDLVSNLRVLYWKQNYTQMKIRAFGSFHEADIYKDIPYEKQFDSLMKLGCDGIKFIQMKPDRRKAIGKGLNDKSYDKALSAEQIHSGY